MPIFINPAIPVNFVPGSETTYTESIPISPTVNQLFRVGASSSSIQLVAWANRIIRYDGLAGGEQQYTVLTTQPQDSTINGNSIFRLLASGSWAKLDTATRNQPLVSQQTTNTTIDASTVNNQLSTIICTNNLATTAHWLCIFDTFSPVAGVTVPTFLVRNAGTANAQVATRDLNFLGKGSWSIRFSSSPFVFTPVTLSQPILVQLHYQATL